MATATHICAAVEVCQRKKKGKANERYPTLPYVVPPYPVPFVSMSMRCSWQQATFYFGLRLLWPSQFIDRIMRRTVASKEKTKPKRNCVKMRRVRNPLSLISPRPATDAFAFCFICISAGVVDLPLPKQPQFGGHGLFEVTLARGCPLFLIVKVQLVLVASLFLLTYTLRLLTRWKRRPQPLGSLIRSIKKGNIYLKVLIIPSINL